MKAMRMIVANASSISPCFKTWMISINTIGTLSTGAVQAARQEQVLG
jgi:hypothetical protein